MKKEKLIVNYKKITTIKSYHNTIWLCFSTLFFGIGLLIDRDNLVNKVELFSKNIDLMLGVYMMVIAVVKLYALRRNLKWLKKTCLMGMLFAWLFVLSAYLRNPMPNNGWILGLSLVGFCYIALYRGDFSE